MKLSIIVPFLNMWQLTHKRLMELYTHVQEDVEIILIDDCSTQPEIKNAVAWWQGTERHKIRYFRNKENLGFGGSCNVGAKIAEKYDADIVAFLSNDVRVVGNFVPELESVFDKYGNNVLVGNRVIYWPGGWNEFTWNGNKTVVPYAEGWFISAAVDGWNELGGFDPLYGKFDYEDLDLSTRAIELGYNIVALGSRYLFHDHQGSTIQTLNVDRMAITKMNREKYIKKWGSKMPKIHKQLEMNTDDRARNIK